MMQPKACYDVEQNQPLLASTKPETGNPDPGHPQQRSRAHVLMIAAAVAFCLLLASLIAVAITTGRPTLSTPRTRAPRPSSARAQGVSDKKSPVGSRSRSRSYPWTNAMLAWQRTAYHFQPEKNWMNDPNGPLYHLGWYHLFYQYNPDSAMWGNITWGHAVSRDLIHWLYLPIAMAPDQWYDRNGVWTGSATVLSDGEIVMLYTGDTDDYVQVQNLAKPADVSDPLLLKWVKYEGNPVMTPPKGIAPKDFRDPTTAWLGPDGLWRLAIGSKLGKAGISLIYKTPDFISFEMVEDHLLHAVPATGMWECVDFYPVSTTGRSGLENSYNGPGVKHVLKASLDDNRQDWYAVGTHHAENDTWTPDDPDLDVGIGLRVDYGTYYASKTFYEHRKGRRISWGWIGETDSEFSDLNKGWASIQAIPRTITFDMKTRSNILQWPVEEVESLRSHSTEFKDVLLQPGSLLNLNISAATQMDISVEFVVDSNALRSMRGSSADAINGCHSTTLRGALGPFGILVLSHHSLSELTPVYFYIAQGIDGVFKSWFCTDKSRSTKATDVDVGVYGGLVPVLGDESYTVRVLVDHSVVEAFGQGGRACISSRVYPTEAIYGGAEVFLFNNATHLNVTASLKASHLSSAQLRPFHLNPLNT